MKKYQRKDAWFNWRFFLWRDFKISIRGRMCDLTEGTWKGVREGVCFNWRDFKQRQRKDACFNWKDLCMKTVYEEKIVCFQWREFKQRKNVYFIWRDLKRCQRKSVCLTEGTWSSIRKGTELKHMPEETHYRNVCKVLVPVRREK